MFETNNDEKRSGRIARLAIVGVAVALSIFVVPALARATTLPTGFTETNVASGLSSPNSFVFLPDGRIFVCQQTGAIRVIDATGALLATPFATLTVNSSGERGLLGIEIDPNFTSNNFVYVYYTATTPNVHNRVSRLTANGNVVVPGSELPLLDLNPLGATNHNGGAIHFGADGKLYIAAGENAVPDNAQSLNNLLGKILRINSDGSIPNDNPFFNSPTPGVRKEIWAYGFRNPWRFTVQPGTGAVFIADVGDGTREEIDIGVSGANFGWPIMEGDLCHTPSSGCTMTGLTLPIFDYDHNGSGAAVTGGDFYEGNTFPAQYNGAFFYGDSVDSFIRYLVLDQNNNVVSDNAFATAAAGPVEIRYHDNAIWYTAINTGQLRRITFPARQPLAGDWDFNAGTSIGLFTPTTGTFALKNANAAGSADFFFGFGPANPSWQPVTGDWDGDGTRTAGLYDRTTATFFLRNSNSAGAANLTFGFGGPGNSYIPLAGDWDGDGVETIGLYDRATGVFFLRNSNTAGTASTVFTFGPGGTNIVPIVGDWDANGTTTVGIYNTTTSTFFLRNSNTAGSANLSFQFAAPSPNLVPVAGDWNGDQTDSIGLYDRSTGVFFLKNANASGNADLAFNYGPTGQ